MKKVVFLIVALCFLTACQHNAQTPPPTPTSTPERREGLVSPSPKEVTPVPSGGIAVEMQANSSVCVDEGDRTLSECTQSLPKITNPDTPGLVRINEYYEEQKRGFDVTHNDFETNMRAALESDPENFVPHYQYDDFGVERNDGILLSIRREQLTFTGGAHGSAFTYGDTFDVQAGDRLSLDDLFTVPRETYVDFLVERIAAQMETLPYEFWNKDYPALARDIFLYECWYLTDDALMIVCPEYSIGPYAIGIVTFELPIAELEEIWKTR